MTEEPREPAQGEERVAASPSSATGKLRAERDNCATMVRFGRPLVGIRGSVGRPLQTPEVVPL